jgi:aerotaxis receptor
VGLAAVLGMGWLLARTIRHSRRDVEALFDAIARNDEAWVIKAAGAREFYPATTLLRAVGARRSFAQYEHFEMQRRAANARREAITEMARTVARETGGAVSQISARGEGMARDRGDGRCGRTGPCQCRLCGGGGEPGDDQRRAGGGALTARSRAGRMTGH